MPAVQQNPETLRCIGYTTCAFSPGNVRCVVTAKTQYSLTNAKDYFTEHLCVGDYYEEGQRVSGQWFGLGAERLGLAGRVQAEDFLRLCENQHPSTGETLTQRLKGTRTARGQVAANRRIFQIEGVSDELCERFSKRHAQIDEALEKLLAAGKISEEVVANLRSWKHSGFSVDQSVRLEAGDQQGAQRLIEYFLRCPFSQARMIEVTDAGKVIYKTDHNALGRFPAPADHLRVLWFSFWGPSASLVVSCSASKRHIPVGWQSKVLVPR